MMPHPLCTTLNNSHHAAPHGCFRAAQFISRPGPASPSKTGLTMFLTSPLARVLCAVTFRPYNATPFLGNSTHRACRASLDHRNCTALERVLSESPLERRTAEPRHSRGGRSEQIVPSFSYLENQWVGVGWAEAAMEKVQSPFLPVGILK